MNISNLVESDKVSVQEANKILRLFGQYCSPCKSNRIDNEKENQMTPQPVFPTSLHQEAALLVNKFFSSISSVDTVLVVNSCARGKAVPESDLDFAILVKPLTTIAERTMIEKSWQEYVKEELTMVRYRQSNQFAQLHLDVINGIYSPGNIENGEPIDSFELEIGNQICYAAPMKKAGDYFLELQNKWLPYYDEALCLQRLKKSKEACLYDIDHIALLVKRGLYFHAFDTLCKAFQKYLQALFIAYKFYPIAYNKWIREQIVERLKKPELYSKLLPILAISELESEEVIEKGRLLQALLMNLPSV